MSRRMLATTLMALGAMACGALAAFLGHQYIERVLEDERRQLEARYDPIEVIVAQSALSSGDLLTTANAAVREVPRTFTHSSAIRARDWAAAEGRVLLDDVRQGEPILRTHLARQGGEFSVPDGHRAITLPVDRESAIAGFLEPGSRVDLLLTMRSPDDGRDFTFPLLEGVRVTATDGRIAVPPPEAGRGNREPARTMTIAVRPEEASRITHARRVGNLTVSLRGDDDGQPANVTPISEDILAREFLNAEMQDRGLGSVMVIVGGRR